MASRIKLGEITVEVTRKDIRNLHLSVRPPDGRVTISAPSRTGLDAIRVFAISRMGWIREQRKRLLAQEREPPREFLDRESHHVWGRRYLLSVRESDGKPGVRLGHRTITLVIRPGGGGAKRAAVMHAWHRALLHDVVPELIRRWEGKLGVEVAGYFLQRMKTKWGGCNPVRRHIRLNTELVKKPKALLEYVIVHEMLHLIEPTHNGRFMALLARHYPNWREARLELNELPLGAETWRRRRPGRHHSSSRG